MNTANSVSILGCGWLGFPLAKHLLSCGFEVKGSTTSEHKISQFQEADIVPFLLMVTEQSQLDAELSGFLQAATWIIALPPGRTPDKQLAYRNLFSVLAQAIPASNVQHIIMISSTSVYGDHNQVVDEQTLPQPTEESGKLLLEMETKLAAWSIPYSILRPGGLIGPNRHPGRFFAGKKAIPDGLAPVNLVHLDDVIRVIQLVIEQKSEGIINVVAPTHPTREEFYTLSSDHLGVERPQFLLEKHSWKQVEANCLKVMGYSFIHPDLMQLYC